LPAGFAQVAILGVAMIDLSFKRSKSNRRNARRLKNDSYIQERVQKSNLSRSAKKNDFFFKTGIYFLVGSKYIQFAGKIVFPAKTKTA